MELRREILLESTRFCVVRHHLLGPDGAAYTKDSIQHPGAVAVVAVRPGPPPAVVLIRNSRVAVGKSLIEIPAGTLEPGEDPLATAARELAEETGYRAGRLEPLGQLLMSPGILNERMHLFLASELSPGASALETGEQIETLVTPWDEALAMACDGRITDAKTIAALLLADRLGRVR